MGLQISVSVVRWSELITRGEDLVYNGPLEEGSFETLSLRTKVLPEKKLKNLLAREECVMEVGSTLHLSQSTILFNACYNSLGKSFKN